MVGYPLIFLVEYPLNFGKKCTSGHMLCFYMQWYRFLTYFIKVNNVVDLIVFLLKLLIQLMWLIKVIYIIIKAKLINCAFYIIVHVKTCGKLKKCSNSRLATNKSRDHLWAHLPGLIIRITDDLIFIENMKLLVIKHHMCSIAPYHQVKTNDRICPVTDIPCHQRHISHMFRNDGLMASPMR